MAKRKRKSLGTRSLETRGHLLEAIRTSRDFSHLADTEKLELLLTQGIMPYDFLRSLAFEMDKHIFDGHLEALEEQGKIRSSGDWYVANPSDRTRPIATTYGYAKPMYSRTERVRVNWTLIGRDILALWYIGADPIYLRDPSRIDRKGSLPPQRGLWMLLQFWRTPEVQKLWREYRELPPNWKIPDDAQ